MARYEKPDEHSKDKKRQVPIKINGVTPQDYPDRDQASPDHKKMKFQPRIARRQMQQVGHVG